MSSKIRINELARELEVKPAAILAVLPELGIVGKKTHSSSIEQEEADRVRRYFGRLQGQEEQATAAAPPVAVEPPPSVEEAPTSTMTTVSPTVEVKKETQPVTELSQPAVEPPPAVPVAESQAPPVSKVALPEVTPVRPVAQPIRPPIASSKPAAPPAPAPPAPERPLKPGTPVSMPAKPVPPPKPGEILSGPRQPLPEGLLGPIPVPTGPRPGKPIAPPTLRLTPPRPAEPARPVPGPPQAPPPPPPRPVARRPERPTVPPDPELARRLAGQPKPATALPARPGKPEARPVPGQPIYPPHLRPGRPLPRPVRPHPEGSLATTPAPAVPGAPVAPPVPGPARRRPAKALVREIEREQEAEGKLAPVRRRTPEVLEAVNKEITITEGITVKELAEKLGVKANALIKKLLEERKLIVTINQVLDVAVAEEIAEWLGAKVTKTTTLEEEALPAAEAVEAEEENLQPRPPVVTVMGHVDHGKTSLLDAIRSTRVAEKEAGGITQHIGASVVEHQGKKIVFIDTPGHEAFTRMRARGAQVTDIVVLVVAADDGVMPQTIEAIDHARAARVPIIVAINKIDKPEANPDRVMHQLAERGLVPERYGGDTVMVPVSARTKQGLDELLEMILLVAEMQELKANPDRPAIATVLEAKLDRGRGPVATVLVRNGTLRVGDHFICGTLFGKVRALFDDRGRPVKEAGPSLPVEVLGLEEVPEVGETFQVVTDLEKARQIVEYRKEKLREQALVSKPAKISLEKLREQLEKGEIKELNVIVKADVGGTAEAVAEALRKLSTDKVRVEVIHAGVGAITETDVLLASTSNAIIVGFNVRPERSAAQLAEQEKVDIRLHSVIYELTDEIKKAMLGLLEPVEKEVYRGRAEVLQIFRIPKVGTVAGCVVRDGVLTRDSQVRILRDNVVIYTGRVASLKRFKDDVQEVKSGFECGVAIENFGDIKPGDVIEAFVIERVTAEALV